MRCSITPSAHSVIRFSSRVFARWLALTVAFTSVCAALLTGCGGGGGGSSSSSAPQTYASRSYSATNILLSADQSAAMTITVGADSSAINGTLTLSAVNVSSETATPAGKAAGTRGVAGTVPLAGTTDASGNFSATGSLTQNGATTPVSVSGSLPTLPATTGGGARISFGGFVFSGQFGKNTTVPTPIAVSISPTTATVTTGGTQQFTATVANAVSAGVNWTVQEGSTGGTIDANGNYTAPATAGTYHVVATSQADATKTATATVTVNPPVSVKIIYLSGTTSTSAGGTIQYSATVTGAADTSVTWSASAGTITANGSYTAPSADGVYTITATSNADPTKLDTINVYVITNTLIVDGTPVKVTDAFNDSTIYDPNDTILQMDDNTNGVTFNPTYECNIDLPTSIAVGTYNAGATTNGGSIEYFDYTTAPGISIDFRSFYANSAGTIPVSTITVTSISGGRVQGSFNATVSTANSAYGTSAQQYYQQYVVSHTLTGQFDMAYTPPTSSSEQRKAVVAPKGKLTKTQR